MQDPVPDLEPSAVSATRRSLEEWIAAIEAADIPVLDGTVIELEALRAREDDVDANRLGDWICADPLMTLKVLAYESGHRGRRVVTAAETVTAAIVMIGISPFFRAFGPQPSVEAVLDPVDGARAGFDAVVARSARGADFALALAVHRTDPHAAMIHAAALLHEFAELLVWCVAPDLALEVSRRQRHDPGQRSRVVQEDVLGVDLETLQRTLISRWRLPPLLDEVATERERPSAHTGARTVMLGTRLARHAAHGWEDAAIPDDIDDIARFINVSNETAEALMKSV